MKFLTTKEIAGQIISILREAKEFIIIVCPYLDVEDEYIKRIKVAMENKVEIIIVFGKTELKDSERQKLQNLHTDNIKFLENLHAKCYMNEETALVTSMNLYKYSEENNREIGIVINRKENENMYAEIRAEMRSIYKDAEQYNPESNNQYNSFNKSNNFPKKENQKRSHFGGHCIRCGYNIPFNPMQPLCGGCYKEWNRYGNSDYPEKFCHKCGREIWGGRPIDYDHPLCYRCYTDGDYGDGHFVFDDDYDDFDDDDDYDDFGW